MPTGPPTQASPTPDSSYACTGLGYTVCSAPITGSGLDGVSAVSAGPWEVTNQALNLEYMRVAKGSMAMLQEYDMTLSSIEDLSGSVNQNFLIFKGEWTVRRRKVTSYFRGSHQQGQRFEVCANGTDQFGNTYGGTPSAGMFGVQGTIRTTQPFRQRIPWDWAGANTSYEFNETSSFFAYQIIPSGTVSNSLDVWDDWRKWLGGFYGNMSYIGSNIGGVFVGDQHAGGYSISQEAGNSGNSVAILDGLGALIRTNSNLICDYYGNPLQSAYYDEARHDYS